MTWAILLLMQREEKLDGTGSLFPCLSTGRSMALGQAAISPFALPQPPWETCFLLWTFYSKKFNGRSWLGFITCPLQSQDAFPDKNSVTPLTSRKVYSVSMGPTHGHLVYVESTDSLTFKELQDHTKLSDEQLVKHLQSLIDTRLILVPELMLSLSEASIPQVLHPGLWHKIWLVTHIITDKLEPMSTFSVSINFQEEVKRNLNRSLF